MGGGGNPRVAVIARGVTGPNLLVSHRVPCAMGGRDGSRGCAAGRGFAEPARLSGSAPRNLACAACGKIVRHLVVRAGGAVPRFPSTRILLRSRRIRARGPGGGRAVSCRVFFCSSGDYVGARIVRGGGLLVVAAEVRFHIPVGLLVGPSDSSGARVAPPRHWRALVVGVVPAALLPLLPLGRAVLRSMAAERPPLLSKSRVAPRASMLMLARFCFALNLASPSLR